MERNYAIEDKLNTRIENENEPNNRNIMLHKVIIHICLMLMFMDVFICHINSQDKWKNGKKRRSFNPASTYTVRRLKGKIHTQQRPHPPEERFIVIMSASRQARRPPLP